MPASQHQWRRGAGASGLIIVCLVALIRVSKRSQPQTRSELSQDLAKLSAWEIRQQDQDSSNNPTSHSFRREEAEAFRELDGLEHALSRYKLMSILSRPKDEMVQLGKRQGQKLLKAGKRKEQVHRLSPLRPASSPHTAVSLSISSLNASSQGASEASDIADDNSTASAESSLTKGVDATTSANATVNKTAGNLDFEFNRSTGTYVSPASFGEEGMAAFRSFIEEHDNFSTAAARASSVVARKNNHLRINTIASNLSNTTTPLYNSSLPLPFSSSAHLDEFGEAKHDEESRRLLIINSTDGSRWFLPNLPPLPVVNAGVRGFSQRLPDAGAAAASASIAAASYAHTPDTPLASQPPETWNRQAGTAERYHEDGIREGEGGRERDMREGDADSRGNGQEQEADSRAQAAKGDGRQVPLVGVHVERRVYRDDRPEDDDVWTIDKTFDMRHAHHSFGTSEAEGRTMQGEVDVDVTLPLLPRLPSFSSFSS